MAPSASGASLPSGAVLFDLDGTLADSAPGITAAINATLREYGAAERPEAELVQFIGPPLQETFGLLLADRAPSVAELDEIVAAYRRRYALGMVEGSKVYPGIAELLGRLHAQGRPLAVATSKAQPLAETLLAGLGLRDRFEVVCGPVPPQRETKTETVAKAVRQLGALAEGAVMVGDRHHDVEGGLASGLPVVGVSYGFGSRDELKSAGATAVAADVAELAALLGAA